MVVAVSHVPGWRNMSLGGRDNVVGWYLPSFDDNKGVRFKPKQQGSDRDKGLHDVQPARLWGLPPFRFAPPTSDQCFRYLYTDEFEISMDIAGAQILDANRGGEPGRECIFFDRFSLTQRPQFDRFRAFKQPGFETPNHLRGVSRRGNPLNVPGASG